MVQGELVVKKFCIKIKDYKGLFGTCFRFLFWFCDFFQYSSWKFNPDLNSRLKKYIYLVHSFEITIKINK